MNKILFLVLLLVAGSYVVRQLSQDEQRERLAQFLATVLDKCMEMMPEGSPPKVMMSGIRRIEEQNDELLRLLRERLPAQEA